MPNMYPNTFARLGTRIRHIHIRVNIIEWITNWGYYDKFMEIECIRNTLDILRTNNGDRQGDE